MNNLDDLKLRIEGVISEVKDIIKLFEIEFADPKRDVSFRQVKEIEISIERFKKQGLPVPEELKQLKLRLFSTYEIHKEFLSLYNKFLTSIRDFASSKTIQKPTKSRVREPEIGQAPYRKPPNYEKPLGSKGYSNVEDYLIPVIKLMWRGDNHRQAFRQIAEKLDVRYNTVSAQCTRALGLTTDEFINQVKSKKIVDLIERKYSDKNHIIKTQLK